MKNTKLLKVKGLIFDLDGTFLDTPGAVYQAMCKIAEGLTLPAPDWDTFRQKWGISWEKYLQFFWPDSWLEAKNYHEEHNPNVIYPVFPQVKTVLKSLYRKKVPMGIASNRKQESLVRRLGMAGVPQEYFVVIQGLTDNHQPKPAVDLIVPVWTVMASMGLKKDQVAYVGDMLDDAKAANAFGIHFIAYCSGINSLEDFLKAGVSPGNITTEPREWLKFV